MPQQCKLTNFDSEVSVICIKEASFQFEKNEKKNEAMEKRASSFYGEPQCGSSSDSPRCVPPRHPQEPICHRQAPHLGHLCVRSKNASMLAGHLCHCRYAIALLVGWRHLCAIPIYPSVHPPNPLILLSTTMRIHITMFGFSILSLILSRNHFRPT